jgi:Capsule polysaccharide biosynthesis protein
MSLMSARRVSEYARKGAELVMRTVGEAPEQRRARTLGAPPGAGGGPRVLFLTPRDWAAHVQYDAVLARSLAQRGAEVQFLTCGGGLEVCDRANTYEAPPMPCVSCARYVGESLDAHGFVVRRLVDRYPSSEAWPELDELSRSQLRDVEIDGLALGRLVDIPVKWFLCAGELRDDPLAGLTTRAFLRSARRIAAAIDDALDSWTPDTVVMLNGLFLFEAVMWAVCRRRGIDVVTYERAFRQETLVFSRDLPAGFYDFGDTAWSANDRELRAEENIELDEYLDARRRGDAFDQYWSNAEWDVDTRPAGSRLAVAFTNITWDTAVLDRDCAFADIRSWIDSLVREFSLMPEHQLIVRVHPSEVRLPMKATRDSLQTYVADAWPTLPANVAIIAADDTTSSYPLMDACDMGLVYTSTTGLELALRGKPVIVAGLVHYRGKGFTNDVSNESEFVDALRNGLADPGSLIVDAERARRYAHFFWFRAPVTAVGVREPIPGLARLTIRSDADLAPGVDAGLDRVCNAILHHTPFVTAA